MFDPDTELEPISNWNIVFDKEKKKKMNWDSTVADRIGDILIILISCIVYLNRC